MDSQFTVTRSLPPLVEGKIHGYLKCIIDEIIWTRRSLGNVNIIACWWGELDNAIFRPVDTKIGVIKNNKDTVELYAIKTNVDLFKEYLINSETVELTIVAERSQQIIGRAHITGLLEIFAVKSYCKYFPIYNEHGNKIGDIHVTLQLTTIEENTSKPDVCIKKSIDSKKLLREFPTTHKSVFYSNTKLNMNNPSTCKNLSHEDKIIKDDDSIYQSILRDKRSNFHNIALNVNSDVTDKLVAQVVARAQKLRGEMFNDTNDYDQLILNDNSTLNSIGSDGSIENEAALYEYFMGKRMSRRCEKKALETLRCHSPTPSLIDFASETIQSCNKIIPTSSSDYIDFKDKPLEKIPNDPLKSTNRINIQRKQASPIDYVDSLRIIVDTLTLNSAGYRRVKSSCLSRGDGIPISVTYFVQYDAIFGNTKKYNKKIINGSKPVKMCSKKQDGEIIYFNHNAVYDLPKTYLHMDMPLKFKVYHRHLNQRTPTELGIGSIYVNDAEQTSYLSSTQRLAIVKKDIKIGELKVTIELGCDKIHFGKQFVEAVTSAKENIPVLELSPNSINISNRYKSVTSGDESKSNSRATSVPEKHDSCNITTRHSNTTDRKINEQNEKNDGRLIKIDIPNSSHDKILLHALIYVGEGKDLPVSNTYLICRAFWREDRTISRTCTGTNNPFYHFHQLIPLIHDQELLNRTKDNCIIIEVYSKNHTGNDNLLGIAKLSVHQLYVAYRDPIVLPHLLKSKYPVTSVDDWVSITNPISGSHCGELSALVALGTADQIALLEMTRGLRDSSVTPQTLRNNMRNPSNSHKNLSIHRSEIINADNFPTNDGANEIINRQNPTCNFNNVGLSNVKTQECQTEISTVNDIKAQYQRDDTYLQRDENTVIHTIVDRLAQALNVPKSIADQAAQTELEFPTRDSHDKINKVCNIVPLCLDESNSNSVSSDSYNNSPRENFNMPREIFRSVGVGAEFDDLTANQVSNTNYNTQSNNHNEMDTLFHLESDYQLKDIENRGEIITSDSKRISQTLSNDQHDIEIEMNSCVNTSFRAIVEIECALHLPKIETTIESIEPSTYVTFENICNNITDGIGTYMMTNIYPYSCNPKYDWRCDTKLSIDLLVKEEMRLIMKVWRVIEPNEKMEINLEKDVIIGFSAIDLSVLTAGFPIVSGWFHIIDFGGKCNGQLKVSVTPLDNIATFGRFNTIKLQSNIHPVNHSNNSSPYPEDIQKTTEKQIDTNKNVNNLEVNTIDTQQIDNEPMIDIGLGLGDASMSFLSQSLKQKLSELDEIKKRLQSRLHDVTNAAFDDDFENDFDFVEHDYEHDNNEKNENNDSNELMESESWQQQSIHRNLMTNQPTNENNCLNNGQRYVSHIESGSNVKTVETITTDTGYSTNSNAHSDNTLTNGILYQNNSGNYQTDESRLNKELLNGENTGIRFSLTGNTNGHTDSNSSRNLRGRLCNYQFDESKRRYVKNYDSDIQIINEQNFNSDVTMTDNHYINRNAPIQGTTVHINYLLEKLSTQLTAAPPPITNLPMKRNIMDLISSLRRNNNNFSNDIKCNREANVRTVPTQTDINYVNDPLSQNNYFEYVNAPLNNSDLSKDDGEIPAKSPKTEKISTIIRDELIADDNNDTIDYDYLSTRLMTSNVRHMAINSSLNPLLYPHILPEMSISANDTRNDVQQNLTSPSGSPEGEAVEQLDSRYVEAFNATINKGLNRLRDISDMESTSSRIPHQFSPTIDNGEIFRVTPTGVSENIDGNIDVTVIHKPCNDDLMASNSIESTTTISLSNNDTQTPSEIDDNNSLTSSDTLVSAVSRQAPDGGNPAEDPGKQLINKRKNQS